MDTFPQSVSCLVLTMSSECRSRADLANFREAPGEGGPGELSAWAALGAERVQQIAWAGAVGVLHARLAPPRTQVPPSELDYLEEAAVLPLLPAVGEPPAALVRPPFSRP